MTHTFDTKNRVTSSSNPALCPITPTSGATLLVVGIVTHDTIKRPGGAPTFNGETLTEAYPSEDAIETAVEMYYLVDPSIGTYNVIVPNTNPETLHIVASVYKAQAGYTSEFDVANGDFDATADPSVSVTTTEDGDAIVDVMGNGYPSAPSSGNQTLLYKVDDGVYCDAHQYALQESAGLIEFWWDQWSDDWCMIVAAFKEVVAPVTGHPWFYERKQ